MEGKVRDAAWRHLASAFARLLDGGRLVAITGVNLAPEVSPWRQAFVALQDRGRVVFSAAIDGRVYARHGTTVETRLTVIDKVSAEDPTRVREGHGLAPNASTLLDWVLRDLPPRGGDTAQYAVGCAAAPRPVDFAGSARALPSPALRGVQSSAPELAYETVDRGPAEGGNLSDGPTRPTHCCRSASPGGEAASDAPRPVGRQSPPKPKYRARLPAEVISGGLLSDG